MPLRCVQLCMQCSCCASHAVVLHSCACIATVVCAVVLPCQRLGVTLGERLCQGFGQRLYQGLGQRLCCRQGPAMPVWRPSCSPVSTRVGQQRVFANWASADACNLQGTNRQTDAGRAHTDARGSNGVCEVGMVSAGACRFVAIAVPCERWRHFVCL